MEDASLESVESPRKRMRLSEEPQTLNPETSSKEVQTLKLDTSSDPQLQSKLTSLPTVKQEAGNMVAIKEDVPEPVAGEEVTGETATVNGEAEDITVPPQETKGNEQAKDKAGPSQVATEADVGVTEFVNLDSPGFSGILKKR